MTDRNRDDGGQPAAESHGALGRSGGRATVSATLGESFSVERAADADFGTSGAALVYMQ